MTTHTVSTTTRQGKVIGLYTGQANVFRAIPYAAAPVGPLRFAPPAPPVPYTELDCTRPGPLAPQLPSRLEDVMGPLNDPQAEDCLHLTIWTPAPDKRKRPVVVWLHGGAWQSGGGAPDWYSGEKLAALGDIVVVAPNYRLAALGWLYVPGMPANLGLLDQEAAVRWVAENIENFGGDPSAITLMGQSAGGSCIAAMLGRNPLFSRAILQSASLGRGFRSADEAAVLGRKVLEAAGARNLEEARALPCQDLLRAQRAPAVLEALKSDEIGRALFCPVVDGDVITGHMDDIRRSSAGKADVLIGYTRNEMAAFPNVHIDDASQAAGDRVFGAPSRAWAEAARAQGRSAWAYRFDHAPTERYGACHCIELPFVFGTLDAFGAAPMLAGTTADDAARLTRKIQSNWIKFIREGAADWPPFPHLEILA
ncbi:carboxylesterase/lipase family protein [Parapusillimonas granuli]|uniref:Carboxylic ester hydrolase n=1 Tax=Parapusillimonas granuli TaxID=380911 RepID=A0A853G0F5_9BURK|nr:carboxylesterase family protein [Parapusillimonas granuli]MBB5213472.1 para-nitrobenzyl esterase [Parapusillimonas granuli]MEB2398565.1 carboxylesterase family protein [Alcaligenaceae bacterium]NYT48311.1 carboxylesterase family protein [Parapusillimonas granuli]